MIELKNLSKKFITSDGEVQALKDVNITVGDGDIYGIIGMSGAGKSTLVRCINMLERPTGGEVIINGQNIGELSPSELRKVRRKVTMIFQSFNLLMQRTCLDNICFPLELAGVKKSDARAKARELLNTVGLPDKAGSYPSQLSGGQQQRIAIARALATNPEVLLCDEATSALDPIVEKQIIDNIKRRGCTCVIIAHRLSAIRDCDELIVMDHGQEVQRGTHEQLSAVDGFYRSFISSN